MTRRRGIRPRPVRAAAPGPRSPDAPGLVLNDIGSAENAAAVVRRLRSEMRLPIMVGDVVIQIDAAIGFALAEPDEQDVDEILRRTDEEMYRVKRAGKAVAPAATEKSCHCHEAPA
jgi:GGDEF domain-containing protein